MPPNCRLHNTTLKVLSEEPSRHRWPRSASIQSNPVTGLALASCQTLRNESVVFVRTTPEGDPSFPQSNPVVGKCKGCSRLQNGKTAAKSWSPEPYRAENVLSSNGVHHNLSINRTNLLILPNGTQQACQSMPRSERAVWWRRAQRQHDFGLAPCVPRYCKSGVFRFGIRIPGRSKMFLSVPAQPPSAWVHHLRKTLLRKGFEL